MNWGSFVQQLYNKDQKPSLALQNTLTVCAGVAWIIHASITCLWHCHLSPKYVLYSSSSCNLVIRGKFCTRKKKSMELGRWAEYHWLLILSELNHLFYSYDSLTHWEWQCGAVFLCCLPCSVSVQTGWFLLRENKTMLAAGEWDISPQLDSLSLCHRSPWRGCFSLTPHVNVSSNLCFPTLVLHPDYQDAPARKGVAN